MKKAVSMRRPGRQEEEGVGMAGNERECTRIMSGVEYLANESISPYLNLRLFPFISGSYSCLPGLLIKNLRSFDLPVPN
jgi:hypothetical protein